MWIASILSSCVTFWIFKFVFKMYNVNCKVFLLGGIFYLIDEIFYCDWNIALKSNLIV